jgi:hypothetical protein
LPEISPLKKWIRKNVTDKTYETFTALNAAVAALIRNVNSSSGSQTSLRAWVFDRFLSRIFDDAQEHRWVLKGGTAMLARITDARATRDIDLLHQEDDEERAVEKLISAASLDLGDFLVFKFYDCGPILENENVPYLKGVRVRFEVRFGVKQQELLTIDVSVTDALPSKIVEQRPANRLEIPGLKMSNYFLYPIENHIADKICAILQTYSTGYSSRTRDLIDLVVIACSFDIAAAPLEKALDEEFSLRRIVRPRAYVADEGWKAAYERMASTLVSTSQHKKLGQAEALVNEFIFGIPKGNDATTWSSERKKWV